MPFTDPDVKLEFALQLPGNDEDVHRTAVPVPQQAGIVAIQLPSQVALEVNRSYRWTLKAQLPPCPNTSSELAYVQGWIDRVNMSSVKAGASEGKSLEYAEQGLWYDAVATLARARALNPKDEDLKQEWADLLRSANLESFADKPLLN